MTQENIMTLAGFVISSGIIQFFINRFDAKHNSIKVLDDKINTVKAEQEQVNLDRYHQSMDAIDELREAISDLVQSDTDMKEYVHYVGDELMGLAHDRLVYLTDRIQKRNAITLKERATLDAIYKPYAEGLNGNGDGKAGYEFVITLPVISESEAQRLDDSGQRYMGNH